MKQRIGVVQTSVKRIDTTQAGVNPYSEGFDAQKIIREVLKPNVEHFCGKLQQAGESGCDLVVLTEDTQGICHWLFCGDRPEVQQALCEEIPGFTTEAYGAVAREFRMYVVAGVSEKIGEKLYNTAVLIDRNGNVAGKYHKTHLPASEAAGITAGDTFPVFATDFGMVGMLVCYDWIFPEAMACLACQGADLVCVPTMAYGWTEDGGEATVKARAGDHSVNVAMSIYPRQYWPGRSCVVNRGGQVLADAGYSMDTLVFADLDVQAYRYDKFESDTRVSDLGGRLFVDRRPEIYGVLTDADSPAQRRHTEKEHIKKHLTPESRLAKVHQVWGVDSSDVS